MDMLGNIIPSIPPKNKIWRKVKMRKNLCLIVVAIAILSMISVYPVQAITMLDQEYLSALAMNTDTMDFMSISGDATSYLDDSSYLVTFDGHVISGCLLGAVEVIMSHPITDLSWEKVWDTIGTENMTITAGGIGSILVNFQMFGIAEWTLDVSTSFDSEETSVEVGIYAWTYISGSAFDYDDCELSLPQYTLSIWASSGGTTDPAPGTYNDYGESVTVKATAYSGYYFNYWLLDGFMRYINPITVTMDSDHDLEAHFAELTLTISASTGGTTDPAPGTYTYDYCESVTVKATAYGPYYVFDYWLLNGLLSYRNPITVTMWSEYTLKAYFEYTGWVPRPCPTLFAWNGSNYVDYGVIEIHNPTGEDVVREVPIQAEDVDITNNKAKFRLREGWEGLEFSESVIDQVELYAINEDGKQKRCPLLSAEHSRLGDVQEYIVSSDDVKAQILLLETIDLTFKVPEDVQGFTFVIEGCNIIKWDP